MVLLDVPYNRNSEKQITPVFSSTLPHIRSLSPDLELSPAHASPLVIKTVKMSKMPQIQQLSPVRSQSSAGRSTLGSDGDSATSSQTMYRQERQQPARKMRSPRFVVAVLAVLVFITQFGASLSDVPSVRLLQEIICRKEHGLAPDSSVEENQCRTNEIQGQLNVITTGALIFGYLPGKQCLPTMWERFGHGLTFTANRHPSRTSLRHARRPTWTQTCTGAVYLGHDLVSADMDRHCLESHTLGHANRLALVFALTYWWRRDCRGGHGFCDRGRCRARGKEVGGSFSVL